MGVSRYLPASDVALEVVTLNGLPALVAQAALAPARFGRRWVVRCDVALDSAGGGRIAQLHTILATRKLSAVPFPASPSDTL